MKENKCLECGIVWECQGNDDKNSATYCHYKKHDCACPVCSPVPREIPKTFSCRELIRVWRIA